MRVRECKNCIKRVHIPDDRTGLIHTDNKYRCSGRQSDKTVAE